MATIRFVLKRLVAQRLLALAMIVTLAFSVGVLVAGPIYADSARAAILSSELNSANVAQRNVRITAFGTTGFDFGRATSDLRKAVTGIPVAKIISQGLSAVRLTSGRHQADVSLLFRAGAGSHLGIRGRPPTAPTDTVVSTGTARVLHIRTGDSITASAGNASVRLTVTGTYVNAPLSHSAPGFARAPTREAEFWFGDLNPFPPPDSLQPLPAVLNQVGYLAVANRLGLASQFAWDVYLASGNETFAQAQQTANQVQSLGFPPGSPLAGTTCLNGEESSCFTTPPLTGFPEIVDVAKQRTANLRVPIYVVVLQIGAVALAVLAGVASLALSRQSFELAVLRSRGFTRRKLLVAQGVQILITAILAYPIGLLIGTSLARLATRSNGPAPPGTQSPVALSPSALIAGGIAVASGAIILLLLSLPTISRTIVEERRQLSREARPLLARIPVEVFVLPLGIAAFYEVKTRGFLPVTQSGSLDPLVVLAPTLLVFAASFVVLRLLLFALRRLERPIGATRSLAAYLAGRRLGRSPGTSFAISLLLVLAMGLLVVSTTYRATVVRNHQDSAHQDVGADWTIRVGSNAQEIPSLNRLPSNTTGIIRTEPSLSPAPPQAPTALAIDPDTYPSGGWWRSDYSSLSEAQIMSELKIPDPGIGLPAGASRLNVRYALPKNRRGLPGLRLAAVVERSDGSVVKEVLGPLDQPSNTLSASISGGRRLLSIVVTQSGVEPAPHGIVMRLRAFTGAGSTAAIPLAGWSAMKWRNSSGEVTETGRDTMVSLTTGLGNTVAGIIPPEGAIPALMSPTMAGQYGAQFEADLGGQTMTFRTIGQSQGFPSILGDFMVVPLRATILDSARVAEPPLAINEVWAMGEDPRSQLRAAGFVPGEEISAAQRVAVFSQLPQSLAVGMQFTAAAGGLGLVVIGVAVGLYFTQRRREFEFASLRAMGSGPSQISGVLLTEQVTMIGFAVVAGSLLGFAVVRLMMPYFGKSLGANFPVPVMVVDWRSLGFYAAAIAATTVFALAMALRAVLSSSVTGVLRGEAE